jgi:hypothetical protein
MSPPWSSLTCRTDLLLVSVACYVPENLDIFGLTFLNLDQTLSMSTKCCRQTVSKRLNVPFSLEQP